jgi:transglutaminase-like putative cysteine protease
VQRREFLRRSAFAFSALTCRGAPIVRAADDKGSWREFEIVTHLEVLQPAGRTRIWLPAPLAETEYQRTLGDTYRAENGFVEMYERPGESLDMLVAEWPDGIAPVLTVTNRVMTRDRYVDLTRPSVPPPETLAGFAPYLRGTRSVPVDGIVKETADRVTRGAGTDIERARAIYDWIVDNTFRDPKIAGGGAGDVRSMLEGGHLGGQSADLSGLFVGLARASGIPARDVYGLRVAPSRLEARSLGLAGTDATRAQHCRTEVYLTGFGWVPIDPADVRKVVLDEPPGHLPLSDPTVTRVRARLFGSWEMNWIAFNYAHDVVLPGARRGPIPYFMYPQAETANGRVNSLDPDAFRYDIAARELPPA